MQTENVDEIAKETTATALRHSTNVSTVVIQARNLEVMIRCHDVHFYIFFSLQRTLKSEIEDGNKRRVELERSLQEEREKMRQLLQENGGTKEAFLFARVADAEAMNLAERIAHSFAEQSFFTTNRVQSLLEEEMRRAEVAGEERDNALKAAAENADVIAKLLKELEEEKKVAQRKISELEALHREAQKRGHTVGGSGTPSATLDSRTLVVGAEATGFTRELLAAQQEKMVSGVLGERVRILRGELALQTELVKKLQSELEKGLEERGAKEGKAAENIAVMEAARERMAELEKDLLAERAAVAQLRASRTVSRVVAEAGERNLTEMLMADLECERQKVQEMIAGATVSHHSSPSLDSVKKVLYRCIVDSEALVATNKIVQRSLCGLHQDVFDCMRAMVEEVPGSDLPHDSKMGEIDASKSMLSRAKERRELDDLGGHRENGSADKLEEMEKALAALTEEKENALKRVASLELAVASVREQLHSEIFHANAAMTVREAAVLAAMSVSSSEKGHTGDDGHRLADVQAALERERKTVQALVKEVEEGRAANAELVETKEKLQRAVESAVKGEAAAVEELAKLEERVRELKRTLLKEQETNRVMLAEVEAAGVAREGLLSVDHAFFVAQITALESALVAEKQRHLEGSSGDKGAQPKRSKSGRSKARKSLGDTVDPGSEWGSDSFGEASGRNHGGNYRKLITESEADQLVVRATLGATGTLYSDLADKYVGSLAKAKAAERERGAVVGEVKNVLHSIHAAAIVEGAFAAAVYTLRAKRSRAREVFWTDGIFIFNV